MNNNLFESLEKYTDKNRLPLKSKPLKESIIKDENELRNIYNISSLLGDVISILIHHMPKDFDTLPDEERFSILQDKIRSKNILNSLSDTQLDEIIIIMVKKYNYDINKTIRANLEEFFKELIIGVVAPIENKKY